MLRGEGVPRAHNISIGFPCTGGIFFVHWVPQAEEFRRVTTLTMIHIR